MTATRTRRLSVGLPVFNGEEYLADAVESILAQTFEDFELIIADNASTDGTESICRSFAARDERVTYHRNATNIGAQQNWYLVHRLSSGEYFASAADDDVYDHDYMRRCIEVLDRDPSVAVCHSRTRVIDQSGAPLGTMDVAIDTTSPFPHDRLYQVIKVDYKCVQLYGVMRSRFLGQTKVFEGYYGCDRNTLAELSLLGKIHEIPEYLFHHRLYPGALGWIVNSGKTEQEMAVVDPGTDWSLRNTGWTVWRQYFRSVARLIASPLERARCYLVLGRLVAARAGARAASALRLNRG